MGTAVTVGVGSTVGVKVGAGDAIGVGIAWMGAAVALRGMIWAAGGGGLQVTRRMRRETAVTFLNRIIRNCNVNKMNGKIRGNDV